MTGASLTDLTSKFPDIVNDCSEKEQITEQTAAFRTDEILENKDDTVSHEIIVIIDSSPETRKGNMRQNSTTKG
jgi:hypothetical protein